MPLSLKHNPAQLMGQLNHTLNKTENIMNCNLPLTVGMEWNAEPRMLNQRMRVGQGAAFSQQWRSKEQRLRAV
jgi:hypothetical protein